MCVPYALRKIMIMVHISIFLRHITAVVGNDGVCMKRKILCVLIAAALTMQLSGCGREAAAAKDSKEAEAPDSFVSSLDASAIAALNQKDNSLDAYVAVAHMPLLVETPKEAMDGGLTYCFLGHSGAFRMKKHVFENSRENWDELSIVTAEGENRSESWKWGKNWDWNNQIWQMGGILGTDHILRQTIEAVEGKGYQYGLIEMDENLDTLREIPLEFLDGEEMRTIDEIVADGEGYIHFFLSGDSSVDGRKHYYVLSSDGAVLVDYDMGDFPFPTTFVPLYDGSVAVMTTTEDGCDHVLMRLNPESGALEQLLQIAPEETPSGFGCFCFTLLDENTLLLADADGIYRRDLREKVYQPLYLWRNHGITVSYIESLLVPEGERIALIYESDGEGNYLCIEPATEEVEIRQITMAVSPETESVYDDMATEFNKRYPACHIEVKSNYENAALLTELIAGDGPVLVDTALTGFAALERQWEPLDEIYSQLGLTEELYPAAFELGKINGRIYGAVKDFYLETVVIGSREPEKWDYDTFLQCISDASGLEAIVNSYYPEQDGFRFVYNFFVHGMEDSYLFDAESEVTCFDTKKFRRILELAKEYCIREDFVYPGSLLREGKVLCNTLTIRKPEQVALYRLCYGEDINYIGYPAGMGSGHYLRSSAPLAIRRTASEEEKEVACAFLQMMLSYECQKKAADDISFSLSVRKDVLEEQINSVNENSLPTAMGFEQIRLGEGVDNVRDAETLYGLLEKARPYGELPQELEDILYEELQQYFNGSISEDIVIKHLENRVGLFLEE